MDKKLLLGTNNLGKVRELKMILTDLNVELVTPQDIRLDLEIKEKGSTYAQNAAYKARVFSEASGLVTLADDSGLEVHILDGAPGLYSARYTGEHSDSDASRRLYLLQRLQGKPKPWLARFRCAVAIISPSGEIWQSEGVCDGEIIPEERGEGGFGYDPIFYMPEFQATMAELDEAKKNQISHRAMAVQAIFPTIVEIFSN
jgi:XTP/dITP diphosphohydrolase